MTNTPDSVNKRIYPEDTEALHDRLWESLKQLDGDGTAAEAMLAAGIPIYYVEKDTPDGLSIKEYPDGRRELVRYSRQGDEVICAL